MKGLRDGLALHMVHRHMLSNSSLMLKHLSTGNGLTIIVVAFVCSGLLSNACAEEGSDSMRFAPQNYSPYQADRSWAPQTREQVAVPYSQPPPVSPAPAPQTKRPYEMLPPSGRGYYPYGGGPGYGGGYPGRGYGGGYPSPGGMWPGGGSWGSMPWGGSQWPGASPFSMFGGPGGGGFPFGW